MIFALIPENCAVQQNVPYVRSNKNNMKASRCAARFNAAAVLSFIFVVVVFLLNCLSVDNYGQMLAIKVIGLYFVSERWPNRKQHQYCSIHVNGGSRKNALAAALHIPTENSKEIRRGTRKHQFQPSWHMPTNIMSTVASVLNALFRWLFIVSSFNEALFDKQDGPSTTMENEGHITLWRTRDETWGVSWW